MTNVPRPPRLKEVMDDGPRTGFASLILNMDVHVLIARYNDISTSSSWYLLQKYLWFNSLLVVLHIFEVIITLQIQKFCEVKDKGRSSSS